MKQKNFQITPEDQTSLDYLKEVLELESEGAVIRRCIRDAMKQYHEKEGK
jgi:hypothetical protein